MTSMLKVLKTETDYDAALNQLDKLLKELEIGKPVGDEIEVLGLLIHEYETEHFPIENPHPIEAIKFMMEQKGMTNSDLGEILGSSSRASEILNLKRGLSLEMIRTLNAVLQIPTDILVQPYVLKGAESPIVEELQARQQDRLDRLKKMTARFHRGTGLEELENNRSKTGENSLSAKKYTNRGKSQHQAREADESKNYKKKKNENR